MLHSFDTHAIVKRFIEGGFKEKQAELIVSTLAESRDYDLSNLATKSDLTKVGNELEKQLVEVKSNIRELETKLDAVETNLENRVVIEVEKSKNEMLKWSIGIAITSVGTITGLIALLLKYFIVQ